jgi:hypothetical protein
MADLKITQLDEATSLSATDLLLAVTDPGTLPITKRITLGSLFASPSFTGNPTAPTQAISDNSTKLATTAFVNSMVYQSSPSWINANEPWVYASANTFIVEGVDARSKYPIGTKLIFNNPALKFAYVVGVAYSTFTTVTINAGSSYTLVNDVISGNFLSYGTSPHAFPGWFSYVPVWTATTTNPVLGNGTIAGRFTINGRMVTATVGLTIGSSTTTGSGQWFISLPLTAGSFYSDFVGTWRANDQGVMNYGGSAFPSATDKVSFIVNGSTYVISTAPFTWADGDNLHFTISYPI